MKLCILFFFLFSNILFAQLSEKKLDNYKNQADRIIRSALVEQKAYGWLKEVCEIGPRLSGSEKSLKAIRYAEDKMKQLDFDKVWLQPVMVPHWERGEVEEAFVVDGIDKGKQLHIASLGSSVATNEESVTAGVIEVKDFDELKLRSSEVKGKIVLFNRPIDAGLVNTFSGYGGAVNQRGFGAIQAARFGAVAVLIRSVTTKMDDNVPHVGSMYYADTIPKIPSAAIGSLDADFLSDAIRNDISLKVSIKFNCRTLPDIQSYNVIGEITGSEYPKEVIVVGGHYDSWDKGDGAHDDASGCLQSMEVLNLLKRLDIKPKRTIRCVFFINEENGVRGGRAYGTYADTIKEKHIAAIESDRGAFTPRGFYVGADSLKILKIQSWLPVLKKSLIDWVEKGGGGVDISFIKNADAQIGYVPDAQRYMDVHHSANDTFESVHPREMELGSAAITILAYLLSEEGF